MDTFKFNVEDKSERICTSTPACSFMTWCLDNHEQLRLFRGPVKERTYTLTTVIFRFGLDYVNAQ